MCRWCQSHNRVPTERSRHLDIQHFAIQEWQEAKDITMRHIPGVICPPDNLTKPLGWILHSQHARRIMAHYEPSTPDPAEDPASNVVVDTLYVAFPHSVSRGGYRPD